MKCPRVDEIIAYLDGELSINRSRDLESHTSICPACAATRDEFARMIHRFVPAEGEFDEPSLKEEILARTRADVASSGERQPDSARRRLPILMPALAAVAAALILTFWPLIRRPDSPRFTTRGSAVQKPDQWISLWVFAKEEGSNAYQRVGGAIAADAPLAFGYLNANGTYDYLMIFAVDQKGSVYWYYPAYEHANTDPSSIPIRPGRHELREEIQHNLPLGRVRLFAVFSKHPLHVLQIEDLIRQKLAEPPYLVPEQLPLEGSGQIAQWLKVVRSGRR